MIEVMQVEHLKVDSAGTHLCIPANLVDDFVRRPGEAIAPQLLQVGALLKVRVDRSRPAAPGRAGVEQPLAPPKTSPRSIGSDSGSSAAALLGSASR
jgi:hypothetical protein